MVKETVYQAVASSQDNGEAALRKFFTAELEVQDAPLSKIELYARPSMGDLLNYMLVKLIGPVDDDTDLEELARDLEYAAGQLKAAAVAVAGIATPA